MKPDPTAAPFVDVLFKSTHRRGGPAIGWIVKLDKELIMRQEGIVDRRRVFDVVDGEVIANRLLLQPHPGSVYIRLMNPAVFSHGKHVKAGWCVLRRRHTA